MINPDDPAFARPILGEHENRSTYAYAIGGLTKREYFAALMLQAIMAGFKVGMEMAPKEIIEREVKAMPSAAVLLADALIVELNKEKP